MGIRLFSDSRSTDDNKRLPGEPSPAKFTIQSTLRIGNFTVVKVHYPNCTTYGGMKIAVYRASPQRIRAQKLLDPHFTGKGFSPIARFPGSAVGWSRALMFCSALSEAEERQASV